MRYTNPITGNHAMATMAAFIQLLPKAFHTTAYRSTDATVSVPIEGRGRSVVSTRLGDDFVVEWVRRDIFVVPSWHHVRHEATDDGDAVLFSYIPIGPFKKRLIYSGRTAVMPNQFVIPPPPVSSVAVAATDARFPVRRIICVGRNYAAHAREMGRDPEREPPFFFLKPADTVVDDGATVPYPRQTNNFHYEIELVVAIGKGGADIPVKRALDHVFGYGIGIDPTRRDLQLQAREQGRRWDWGDWGKGFDLSAPIALLHPVSETGHPTSGRIWLAVNGERRAEAGLRYCQANLAAGRNHFDRVAFHGAATWRLDHDRHPRRRRAGSTWRGDDRRH